MDEQAQAQAIVKALQSAADTLSLAGQHLQAANVMAGQQLLRTLWAQLHPPKAAEEPAESATLKAVP